MRPVLLAACLAVASTSASAASLVKDARNQSITSSMKPLPVSVVGRVRTEPLSPPMPHGSKAFIHQWPGVYFEAAFRGDRVALAFDDTANEYRLTVDGSQPLTIAQPGRAQFKITGLHAGLHHLRLEKVTESIDRIGAFDGFYVPADERPAPVRQRARQIEFIGDSAMTGYGLRSSKLQCTQEEIRLTSDTQRAFPAIVAKRFDADYQVIAVSGRGLVRNYGGSTPGHAMLQAYPYTEIDGSRVYADASWRPQIILISLFNDIATDLQPGEKWKNLDELGGDYVTGYRQLIDELHRRSPSATLLLVWPDDSQAGDDPHMRDLMHTVRRGVEDAGARAGAKLAFFSVTVDGAENTACDHHGNLRGHELIAATLTRYLEAHPALWQAR